MKWRIVIVPYPFDDLSQTKLRPALCLTHEIGTHRHIVLAYITSVMPTHAEPTDLLLDPSAPDMVGCGLKVPSTLRLHRLITLPRGVLARALGRIPSRVQTETLARLNLLFTL
jgi:mRNA interferase MazF